MRILVLNAGSATLKFGVVDTATSRLCLEQQIEQKYVDPAVIRNLRGMLRDAGEDRFEAIAHRIAHGGADFAQPVVVTPEVEHALNALAPLAPLHNPAGVAGIRAARACWPEVPHVAVFDTAFHASMPERAVTYAVPTTWRAAGLRRFGFHGHSHQHAMDTAGRALGVPPSELRIVSCHLGSGASVCAIDHGRSVDTSMGLTALEGLPMGTRCGDLDPGAATFLARRLGLSLERFNDALYRDSGLHALSGVGADMRNIEAAAKTGDMAALLALDIFCYRVKKFIGAYAAAMSGIDAIVFTGGIGENSAEVRRRVSSGLEFLGVRVDEGRNLLARPTGFDAIEAHDPRSQVKVLVVHSQEIWVIAHEARSILVAGGKQSRREDRPIPVAVSARHVHLTRSSVRALFGAEYELRVLHPLTQPGFWAAMETVALAGPRGRIEHVRVLGPCREANQIEISRTDAVHLGVDAPLRLSGDTTGTPSMRIIGPAGELVTDGVIVAKRHFHLTTEDASRLGIGARLSIDVKLDTPRPTVLRDVAVRVAREAVPEIHLDTDEANAAGIEHGGEAVLFHSDRSACMCTDGDCNCATEGGRCTVAPRSERFRKNPSHCS